MGALLRVLIVEDSEDDALLLVRHLERAGYEVAFERVEDAAAWESALERRVWDIVIADYQVPGFGGLAALRLFREKGLDQPFIIVSGVVGEDTVVETMKAGAHDYLLKNNLIRLVPAIERELREAEVRRERKRAEQAVVESRNYLDKIINSVADPIFVKDRQHRWVLINDALCGFMGHNRNELLWKSDYDFFPKNEADVFWSKDEIVFTTARENINEEQFTDAKGIVHTISTKRTLYTDEKGEIFIVGIMRDITEIKTTEEALRQSREKYRRIVDTANEGVLAIDENHRISFVNARMTEMLGYQGEKMTGREVESFFFPEDLPDHQYRMQNRRRGISEHYERRWRRKDGEAVWTIVSATPIFDSDRRFRGSFAMLADITERKRAEEKLRAMLREKEILLKEIHHRVKNNMQLIVSLLNMQSKNIENEELLRYFNECKNRIWAMSLIHQKLYQSENFSGIDLPEYIKTLAAELRRVYRQTIPEVDFSMDAEEITISIENAIPCSLIANEIMTNSLKHAFPPGWNGKAELRVSIHESRDGIVDLILKDNGIGILPEIEPGATDTLGLTLIDILSRQIGGRCAIDRENGTKYTITFKNR